MISWFRYLRWFFRSPPHPVAYNMTHAHKIDRESWKKMQDRWLEDRP